MSYAVAARLFDDGDEVVAIPPEDTYPLLLNVHYAGRIPSISYAFGLYDGHDLEGVVTYGTPPSPPLREGLAGPKWASHVLELNRLVLIRNRHNDASRLVGASLRMLPRPSLVVSYADTSHGHTGTVYQATNFLYTGLSAKRTDWHVEGLEELHGITVADLSRGQDDRAGWMRETYGERFTIEERPRKHRYVYLVGSKSERRRMRKALRYETQPYPSPESDR